jgi:hypothetical protein
LRLYPALTDPKTSVVAEVIMHGFDPVKVRRHRLQEAELGFPLLRGCASTEAISLVLYLESLDQSDRSAFADQLSSLEERQPARPPSSNEEIFALVRGFPLVAEFLGRRIGMVPIEPMPIDVRRLPVKVLANVLADERTGGFEGWSKIVRLSGDPAARLPTAAHAASVEEIVPVEPRRLRRLFDHAMSGTFGATPQLVDKQHVRYDASHPTGGFRVDLMFAAPGRAMHQFEYRFSANVDGRRRIWMEAYESVWRLAPRWDYVTQANAERSVAHLATLVAACMDLA